MQTEIEITKTELNELAASLTGIFIQRRDLYAKQLDDGRSWQSIQNLSYDGLPITLIAGQTHLIAANGKIDLTRPGAEWLA